VKKELVITDVTRMQEGRVCVAGYDRKKMCVRPTLPPPGIHETSLYSKGKPLIFPFAVVEFDLLEHVPEPPHTEDWRYDPRSVRLIKQLSEKEKQDTLKRLCNEDVASIFGAQIYSDPGYYVLNGEGVRSLGTIHPRHVLEVVYEKLDDAWKYRLKFDDGRVSYRLTVTDLAWRYYCDAQRGIGKSPAEIATELLDQLNASQTYLRIGLARGWSKFPERCYLQITGVYTFPDYLAGRTFADFSPPQK
jgi:hypothetical protein